MKLRVCFVLASLFVVFSLMVAPQSFAAEGDEVYSWGQKLGRGALNIISSPVEIARQIQVTSNDQNLLAGWSYGLVKGVGYTIGRIGVGVADLLTCPFDWPKANKAPIMNPEFVWENEGVQYT